jgi:hypothetical protein
VCFARKWKAAPSYMCRPTLKWNFVKLKFSKNKRLLSCYSLLFLYIRRYYTHTHSRKENVLIFGGGLDLSWRKICVRLWWENTGGKKKLVKSARRSLVGGRRRHLEVHPYHPRSIFSLLRAKKKIKKTLREQQKLIDGSLRSGSEVVAYCILLKWK